MKTAVEWMVEKLFKPMDNPPIENVSDIIEQSKELEKQQIIDAVNSQRQLGWDEKGEQYYTETFNK